MAQTHRYPAAVELESCALAGRVLFAFQALDENREIDSLFGVAQQTNLEVGNLLAKFGLPLGTLDTLAAQRSTGVASISRRPLDKYRYSLT